MTAVLYVLAGVNGSGKSSVGGEAIRRGGLNYFNPDEAAIRIRSNLGCSDEQANADAWEEGRKRLLRAIAERTDHAFETTLGGKTIPKLIAKAADAGFDVHMWYVGLATVEQNIARVKARVARGGHDIPEEKIRERWDTSRLNLIRLIPRLTELRLFDNSAERDPKTGAIPPPLLLLHCRRGAILAPPLAELHRTPDWAQPIVGCALKLRPI